jgi:hypothetical protein
VTTTPSRAALLSWLDDHPNATTSDAVSAVYGDLPDDEFKRRCATARKWKERAGKPASATRPPPADIPPPVHPSTLSSLERVPYLQRELDALDADLAAARDKGERRLVPSLSKRAAECRAQLDEAKAEAAKTNIKLDRSVRAVCKAMLERQKQIEMLAKAGGAEQ